MPESYESKKARRLLETPEQQERGKARRKLRDSEALWRRTILALPATGPPSERDMEWVYHLLPVLECMDLARTSTGKFAVPAKYILDAPSRGAVAMLLNALEDPTDFNKAAIEVVKGKSKKDDRKQEKTTIEEIKEQDPGLDGLEELQRNLSSGGNG